MTASDSRQARSIDADEEAALLDGIDRWIEREVRPVVMHYDHEDLWPAELVEQMREMGLFGATIGQEYGGLGLPASTYAKIIMRISAVWMALSGIFNSHLMMAAAVERFGTGWVDPEDFGARARAIGQGSPLDPSPGAKCRVIKR